MATASQNVRKVRRLKRERAQAFRALAQMNANFEGLRSYAQSLRIELDKYQGASQDTPTPTVSTPGFTLTTLPDEETENIQTPVDNLVNEGGPAIE